jgi:glycine/sarcosine N-methyltransferase
VDPDPTPATFYDDLADDYHLIFADWDASIGRQALFIKRLLDEHGVGTGRVLDASCGIGTQAIGLAQAGFDVMATDISEASVARCAREASQRGLRVRTAVADLRSLDRDVAERFDAVVSFDNALPHLLADEDLAAAAGAVRSVLRPGGVLCASIRDYDAALESARRATCPGRSGPAMASGSCSRSGTGTTMTATRSGTSCSKPERASGAPLSAAPPTAHSVVMS